MQEVCDSSVNHHPLTGEGAPTAAPPVGEPGSVRSGDVVTGDLYSELTRPEVAWLVDTNGELPPTSPVASFGGLGEEAGAETPAARGLAGERMGPGVHGAEDPRTRARVTVPGAT